MSHHNQELEAIEEQWRTESNDLMTMVSRLQDENRRILKQQSTSPSHTPDPSSNDPPPPAALKKDDKPAIASTGQTDFQMLQRLRAQIEKQRHDLKLKEVDLQAKSSEVENVSGRG